MPFETDEGLQEAEKRNHRDRIADLCGKVGKLIRLVRNSRNIKRLSELLKAS